MTEERDGLDYDAWGAPPAPDVTDAVITRARVPVATATETVGAKRPSRAGLLAGGAIALSAAVIVIAVLVDRSNRPPPSPSLADLRVEELEKKVDELEAAIEKLNAIGAEPTPAPAVAPPSSPVTVPPPIDPEPPTRSPARDATPPPPPPETPTPASDKAPRSCDADALVLEGKDFFQRGNWRGALTSFTRAYACKASSETARLAGVSACKARRVGDAHRWYRLVAPAKRAAVLQACLAVGIDLGAE